MNVFYRQRVWNLTLLMLLLGIVSGCTLLSEPGFECFVRSDTSGLSWVRDHRSRFTWHPAGDRIIFLDDEGTHLYSINVFDDEENSPLPIAAPTHLITAWSPSADGLAYQDGHGTTILYPDVQKSATVYLGDGSMTPVWAAEGNLLAYARRQDPTFIGTPYTEVFMTEPKDAEQVQAFRAFENLIWPEAWSPDGGSLLLSHEKYNPDEIQFIVTDTKLNEVKRTAVIQGCGRFPAWSPDSTRVAFSSSGENNWDILILEMEKNVITENLTASRNRDEFEPAWSPDGQYIAYTGFEEVSDQVISQEIYVIEIKGGHVIQLTDTSAEYESQPRWSPDGEWVAFLVERDGVWHIDIIRQDGTARLRLVTMTGK